MSSEELITDRLTASLKASSREIHSVSDALVNSRLVALFGDRRLYGQAISCFYWVLKEIEDCLSTSWGVDKRLASMKAALLPLFRTAAFEQDLAFYLGRDWRSLVTPMPEVQAYVAYIRALADSRPVLLLAHSYTQHSALLAGGQIIRKLARKGMQLPADGGGTAIYEYPGSTVGELRRGLREALNSLARDKQLSEDELRGLEAEHVQAFKFNNQIIRAFPMGTWRGTVAFVRATLTLTPPKYMLGFVALVTALVALRLMPPYKYPQPGSAPA